MMKPLGAGRKIALVVLLILVGAGLGMWGGMKVDEYRINNLTTQSEQIATTIAIVNMDYGVDYNGEHVNYANSFISMLGIDVVVVSSQLASQGLKSGAYGGVITIPTDMSARIVSINAENPTQVVLSYQINDNLPRNEYIGIYQRINDAQQTLNSSLSYVFISSIFEEVHKGQEKVSGIKASNKADLKAVEELKNTNFMQGLTLPDIAPVKPDFKIFEDGGSLSAAGEAYTTTINGFYFDEFTKMNDVFGNKQKTIDDAKDNIGDWKKDYKDYRAELEDYRGLLDGYHDDLSNYFDNELSVYVDDLESFYTDADGYYGDLSNYFADLVAYQLQLDNYRDGLASGSTDPFSGTKPAIPADALSRPVYDNDLDSPPEMPQEIQDAADQIDDDFSSYPKVSELSGYLDDIYDALESYDPEKFFDSNFMKKVDSQGNSFGSEALAAVGKMQSIQAENYSLLLKAQMEYQDQVRVLRENTADKYKKDGVVLAAALDEFYAQKLSTSSETAHDLSSISKLLPYSWYDGAVNSRVTEFIASPITVEDNPYSSDLASGLNAEQIRMIILLSAGLITLIALLLFFIRRRKNRDLEDSYLE